MDNHMVIQSGASNVFRDFLPICDNISHFNTFGTIKLRYNYGIIMSNLPLKLI